MIFIETIDRLRRSLPRKTDLDTVSTSQLRAYADRLDNTPRKCLDFQTPAERLAKLTGHNTCAGMTTEGI